jgi:hypothetical protein
MKIQKDKPVWIAVFWLGVPVAMNLVALLLFKKASAAYFSDQWWSVWFPIYLVSFTIAIIRFGKCCKRKTDDTEADA